MKRICDICAYEFGEDEPEFRYFSDEGKELKVCAKCYAQLKKKDYKSGENREDGSSM